MFITKFQSNFQTNLKEQATKVKHTSFTSLVNMLEKTPKGLAIDVFEETTKFSEKYYKAKAYLKLFDEEYKLNHKLYDYDMESLDGIQEGIKVFEGLSMKEIKFITKDFKGILLSRGCRNNCVHCGEFAEPPLSKIKEKMTNSISTIAWEDFLSITDGIKEISNRLGFNVCNTTEKFQAPFIDADPINFKSFDKNGKPHNIAEAYKILDETFNLKGQKTRFVFDTSGWFKNDDWSRKAAQDMAKLAQEKPEMFYQFNVSINPFHKIISKSIDFDKQGNIESAKKLRELYTDRMAEALLTFSPALASLKNKFNIIYRSMSKLTSTPDPLYAVGINNRNLGYNSESLNTIYSEIIKKYETKFNALSEEEQKQLQPALEQLKKTPKMNYIISLGRASDNFFNGKKAIIKLPACSNKVYVRRAFYKYIDANGKIILEGKKNYNDNSFKYRVSTDLQLNFANKDKNTKPLEYFGHIDRNFINEHFD